MTLPLWLGASVPGWVEMSVHWTPDASVRASGEPDASVPLWFDSSASEVAGAYRQWR
jgi:hypothetical protein